MAARSAYYDHMAVPDAGELARHIAAASTPWKGHRYLGENASNLNMTTLSASLTATGLSTLKANQKVRSLLLRAYIHMPLNSVGGVFGKTLWIFASTNTNDLPSTDGSRGISELDQVSDVLESSDYSHIDRFHLRGWISAVASALRRRSPELGSPNSRHVVHEALMRLRSTDWECEEGAQTALATLKAFTQPTWWTTINPAKIIDDRRDLHFNALLNERQYRQDASAMDLENWTLAVTDVAGHFLGSARQTSDLMRAAADGTAFRLGIATRVLRALDTELNEQNALIGYVFQERLNAAQELARTLQLVAERVTELGGRAYATHGDGVSIILPPERWKALLEQLGHSSIPLPVVLGGAPIIRAPMDAELAAERALARAKASRTAADQWIVAHIGDEDPTDFRRGLRRLQRLAESNDVVEKWIGLKGLGSIASSS
jgi:hypothetical protein